MKVYELIQQLVNYDADAEVKIALFQECYSLTVEVEEDLESGEETEVSVDLDDTFDIDVVGEGTGVRLYTE